MLLILTVMLLIPLAALRATEAPQSVAKPNILFMFGDDWAWPHASCLGTPGIRTPTFDRLAREGVLFRNAHVAAPSCSPSRAAILTGMERHVVKGRTDGDQAGVGYPMRTIITKEFHYIRNFSPNRWPAGDPPAGAPPSFDEFVRNTYAGFADVDAGPSKAWLLTHPDDPSFPRAFGKRPSRELFDLRKDPFELKNVAEEPAYAATVKELDARLMAELKATNDPRATGTGDEFDGVTGSPSDKPK